jgi:hypothetical protein
MYSAKTSPQETVSGEHDDVARKWRPLIAARIECGQCGRRYRRVSDLNFMG